jgi:hypothetical protein
MFGWSDFWAGLVLPAALAAAVPVAAWRIARGRASARDSRSWGAPAAVAAAFVAGYWALLGRPELPPLDALDWLFYLAPALAVVGTADAWLRLRFPARAVLIAASVAATFVLVAWPLLGGEASARILVAGALATASIVALDALAVRISAARSGAILLAAAAPAAVVVMLSGSQRLGQIGGLLAATAGGMLAVNFALGSAAVGRGTVVVFGTLAAGLLLCSYLYAELQTADAVLLAIAPNMAWVAYLVPRRAGRLAAIFVQLGLVLGTAAIALVRAWLRFVEDSGWG